MKFNVWVMGSDGGHLKKNCANEPCEYQKSDVTQSIQREQENNIENIEIHLTDMLGQKSSTLQFPRNISKLAFAIAKERQLFLTSYCFF